MGGVGVCSVTGQPPPVRHEGVREGAGVGRVGCSAAVQCVNPRWQKRQVWWWCAAHRVKGRVALNSVMSGGTMVNGGEEAGGVCGAL